MTALAFLSANHADIVVSLPGKRIPEVPWTLVSNRRQKWETKVTVSIPHPEFPGNYVFDGAVSPMKFEFAFLAPGGQPLRIISTPQPNHWDPLLEAYADPEHKHFWHSDMHKCLPTYVPSDINWSDAESVLVDFLKECRIECSTHITMPVFHEQPNRN